MHSVIPGPCGVQAHRVWGAAHEFRLMKEVIDSRLDPGPGRAQQTRSMAQAFLKSGAKLMADWLWTLSSLQIPAQFLPLPSLNPYYYYSFKLPFPSVES